MEPFVGPPGPDILVAPVNGDAPGNERARGAATSGADDHPVDHGHPDQPTEPVGTARQR